jgi:hypothetical protein
MSRTVKVGEFLDSCCGVVERGEQGRVAAAVPGGPVGLGEQAAGLLDGEVDGWLGLFLGGDGEDVLAAGQLGGVLGLQPPGERVDRREALVAGRSAVVPADLQPVQEPGNGGGVDAVQSELFGWDGSVVAEEDDQEFERVAVGDDRVG